MSFYSGEFDKYQPGKYPTGPSKYQPTPVMTQPLGRDKIMGARGYTAGGTPQGSSPQTGGANRALSQQMRDSSRQASGTANTKFQQGMTQKDAALAQKKRGQMDENWMKTMADNYAGQALMDRGNLNNLKLYLGLL